jgi:hypothetical protein
MREAIEQHRALLLGYTPTHADHDAGSLALVARERAELGVQLLLRLLPHRAGVHQDHVCVGGAPCGSIVRVHEQVGHLLRIVLVHLAPEGAYEEASAHGAPA